MSNIRYKLRKLMPTLIQDAATIKDKSILNSWRILKYIIESNKSVVQACQLGSMPSNETTSATVKYDRKFL